MVTCLGLKLCMRGLATLFAALCGGAVTLVFDPAAGAASEAAVGNFKLKPLITVSLSVRGGDLASAARSSCLPRVGEGLATLTPVLLVNPEAVSGITPYSLPAFESGGELDIWIIGYPAKVVYGPSYPYPPYGGAA